ncbi:hypothetical protein AMS68_005193 [Peltaster fructicola]|uniref:Uncharacterized protein n=1 Tax=Peltaster fructicola TaxID=286661 RepID=A0A6H0XYC2_9PEZI|nr:hypothetical protein AMS68_005193 [Peltaster fructicola]
MTSNASLSDDFGYKLYENRLATSLEPRSTSSDDGLQSDDSFASSSCTGSPDVCRSSPLQGLVVNDGLFTPDTCSNPVDELDLTSYPEDECWEIDKSTAKLLATVLTTPQPNHKWVSSRRSWRDIMLELPVLEHDHELHMQELWERNTVEAELPAHGVSAETALDYAWTASELESIAKIQRSLDEEKLDVTRDTKTLLASLISMWDNRTDLLASPPHRWVSADHLKYSDVLLPFEIEPLPQMSSQPDLALLTFSSDTNEEYTAMDIRHRVSEMMDLPSCGRAPIDSTQGQASTLEPKLLVSSGSAEVSPYFQRAVDVPLKVISPLLPRSSASSRLSGPGKPIVKQQYPSLELPDDVFSSNTISDDDFYVRQFQAQAQPFYDAATRILEKEQLNELDTTLRLPLPELEDESSRSAWQSYCAQESHIGSAGLLDIIAQERRWAGLSKLEKSLLWTPFELSRAHIKLPEDFDAADIDNFLTPHSIGFESPAYETRPQPVIELSLELTPMNSITTAETPSQHVAAAGARSPSPDSLGRDGHIDKLRKPSLHLIHTMRDPLKRKRQLANNTVLANLVRKRIRVEDDGKDMPLFDCGLKNFLQLNGVSATASLEDTESAHDLKAISRTNTPECDERTTVANALDKSSHHAVDSAQQAHDDRRYDIVVSSQVITRAELIRGLEQRLPQLHMVEREALHLEQIRIPQHEADITISPSTGLMLTTLQKLKQRPLPGQIADVTFRARIAAIADRYGSLFVLVSEGSRSGEPRSLQDQDCDAMADFIAWTSSFETCVTTLYIAGGEDELASCICSHVICAGTCVSLVPEESRWEHILRMLGLNAFAAQTIAATCIAEPGVQTGQIKPAQFFAMEPRERYHRYAALLGGSEIVDRLRRSIDRGWFDIDIPVPRVQTFKGHAEPQMT